jgi:predicted nucleic acid-binding protein
MTRMRGFRSDELYTTAITEAELRRSLALLPPGRKLTARRMDVDRVLEVHLESKILPFDSAAAKAYATLTAARTAAGRPISFEDAQIAAVVLVNRAVLVTRDTRDFEGCGFELINPWN